ncbi:hypothetical protein BUALT_Bualt10G0081200 [Buddleja alternifolia]|uniref:Las1-like protein n=1 Tax=Buddleja alternifolia TaxID=168488 RepID=A0AAV6WX11_9LAMI|nr:hypothetical protein BUALT_Bualt10G0081200 [Buddleja alternifolia]
MESSMLGLGFKDPLADDVVEEEKSHSLKVVPWISWDEWKFVKDSLFCSSPHSVVASALRRISTWRSRGCVPVAIEVTASIVEIQQKDPFFRNDLNESASQSEEMLAMLYCMAIMRLVNGVVEKTRKKNEISIGEAADAIGIPRMLIDIRHEGSHRDLPSLQLVRLASAKALDWLISYYWEPQEKAIPSQNNQTANIRKEIKRKLREAALCLKARQTAKSSSSHVKEKCGRQTEHLYGLNKFLFPVAGKPSLSDSAGSKRQVTKSLKKVLRLYSSFSPEVVYVMLEYLLNALDSSNLVDHVDDSQSVYGTENMQTAYDEWRSVVLKLSRKEPEFLLTLTQAVLEKMETHEAMNLEPGDNQSPENPAKSRQIKLLSFLFERLVGDLKKLHLATQKESAENKDSVAEKNLPKATLLGLIHRCLLVSSPVNKQLMASAIDLAHLTGDISLLQKLKKLALLWSSNSDTNSVESCNETLLSQQEDSIRRAEEKFKLIIRQRQKQSNIGNPKNADVGIKSKWGLAKSWNPCPIGMLPHTIGFAGRVPDLDCTNAVKLSENKEHFVELNECGKREAESGVEELDNTLVKKVKETEEECATQNQQDIFEERVKRHLSIGGVWKKVEEEELLAKASSLRFLV